MFSILTESNKKDNKKDKLVSEPSKITEGKNVSEAQTVNTGKTDGKKTDNSNIAATKTDQSDTKSDKVDSENTNSLKEDGKTIEESQNVAMDMQEGDSKNAAGDTRNETKTEEGVTDKTDKKAIDPKTGEVDEDPELTRYWNIVIILNIKTNDSVS